MRGAAGYSPEVLGRLPSFGGFVAAKEVTVASSEGGTVLPFAHIRGVGIGEDWEGLVNELKARTWESGGNGTRSGPW